MLLHVLCPTATTDDTHFRHYVHNWSIRSPPITSAVFLFFFFQIIKNFPFVKCHFVRPPPSTALRLPGGLFHPTFSRISPAVFLQRSHNWQQRRRPHNAELQHFCLCLWLIGGLLNRKRNSKISRKMSYSVGNLIAEITVDLVSNNHVTVASTFKILYIVSP